MVQKWKNFADFSALLPSRSALTTGVKLIEYFAQICEWHLASAFRRLACATMLQLQMSQFEIQVLSVQNLRPRAYIFMLIMISWLILTSFKINAKCLWVSIPASLKTCTESVHAVQNLKTTCTESSILWLRILAFLIYKSNKVSMPTTSPIHSAISKKHQIVTEIHKSTANTELA